jgi:hypothetical protein
LTRPPAPWCGSRAGSGGRVGLASDAQPLISEDFTADDLRRLVETADPSWWAPFGGMFPGFSPDVECAWLGIQSERPGTLVLRKGERFLKVRVPGVADALGDIRIWAERR